MTPHRGSVNGNKQQKHRLSNRAGEIRNKAEIQREKTKTLKAMAMELSNLL
jgi:hypothetical protein